jgi:hypothetical protein
VSVSISRIFIINGVSVSTSIVLPHELVSGARCSRPTFPLDWLAGLHLLVLYIILAQNQSRFASSNENGGIHDNKPQTDDGNAAVPRITPVQAREMMAKGNALVIDVRCARHQGGPSPTDGA